MNIFIDSREIKLIDHFQHKVTKKCLDIGDIVLDDGMYEIIIERKTWTDLYASVCDGRYREQRARLLTSRNEKRVVMYVIEGDGVSLLESSVYEMCRRTLYRLMIAYCVPVHFTRHVKDTVEWIEWMAARDTLGVFFQTRNMEQDRIENVLQRRDKKSIQTPKNLLVGVLSSIHGVSYSLASTIAESFQSLHDMCTSYDTVHDILNNTEYVVEKTKNKKKMSQKLVHKILFLFGMNNETVTL
jgi:ERCC4-type nuclease